MQWASMQTAVTETLTLPLVALPPRPLRSFCSSRSSLWGARPAGRWWTRTSWPPTRWRPYLWWLHMGKSQKISQSHKNHRGDLTRLQGCRNYSKEEVKHQQEGSNRHARISGRQLSSGCSALGLNEVIIHSVNIMHSRWPTTRPGLEKQTEDQRGAEGLALKQMEAPPGGAVWGHRAILKTQRTE